MNRLPSEPPPKVAPAELERIVSKAIEKEPDYRYQSMEELATDLRRLRRDFDSRRITEPVEPAAALRTAADWKMPVAVGVIAVLLAVVGWLGWRMLKAPGQPAAAHVVQFTALPGLEDSPTWSPEGRSIAYVSDAAGQLDIYVQQIAGGRAVRLTDSDADDAQPAWSPDGSNIAFVSARAYPGKRLSTMLNMGTVQPFFAGRNGDVWLMAALGGTARRIAENAYYPSWSPDGKQLVYQASREGRWVLWVSRLDGGGEPRVLDLQEVTAAITTPAWSPDGKWIAYCKGSVFQGAVPPSDSAWLRPRSTTASGGLALTSSVIAPVLPTNKSVDRQASGQVSSRHILRTSHSGNRDARCRG